MLSQKSHAFDIETATCIACFVSVGSRASCGANFKSKGELDGHMQREHAQQPSEKTAIGQEKTKEQD